MTDSNHYETDPSTDAASATPPDALAKLKAQLEDFYAYLPAHQYIYRPTGDLWPASSVNGSLPMVTTGDGKAMRPADWLDQNRAVRQMVWDPKEAPVIHDRVMQSSGYITKNGASILNLYRPPTLRLGDPRKAGPWIDHLRKIYPDGAQHIENYFAYKIQNPGAKINHALILGGSQGIGKDSLLEPIKSGIGPWNWQEISPSQMTGRFNGWVKCVMLRISEAGDLGPQRGQAFYEQSKALLAAPPDVIRVDEKNLREHDVANVCGVIITTNHKSDGLFLPADDRRHFVVWSNAHRDDFAPDYWSTLYRWFEAGGTGHVIAYLAGKDISVFDAKAPPPKTPAFWEMVQANALDDDGELQELVAMLGSPPAFTLSILKQTALNHLMLGLADELADKKFRKGWGVKFARLGFIRVHNPTAVDGLFLIKKRRETVYSDQKLSPGEQLKAAYSIS